MACAETLASPLTVKTAQEGFAGTTGTTYTVQPDGHYEVADFVGDQQSPPRASGQLTDDDLGQIAEALQADMASATEGAPPVNQSFVEVVYGEQSWTVIMQPGAALEACADDGEPDCAVRTLATQVRSAIEKEN